MTNKQTKHIEIFSFEFIKILLRSTGQVMFQNNAWCGLLFLCGIFWGSYSSNNPLVAWGALVGLAVSVLTGLILNLPTDEGRQGLWGFNGVLVGCALPTFMGNTVGMWLALILCAAMTTWVRTGFNNVMAPWRVNSLTFPFVFCTLFFLLAGRAMHQLPATHLSLPTLPHDFSTIDHMTVWAFVTSWLKGVALIFLIDSAVTGVLFLVGLAIADVWAALWASIGSLVALIIALCMGTDGDNILHGLYGFSAVLTAIALATTFYKPSWRSALWALIGIVATVFIQAAANILCEPWGLPTLTAPFCVATWLFLLPLFKFRRHDNADHSNWHRANKTHLKN